MRCLYCGNELALLKKLTGGGEFCSEAHRQKYQEEYNRLALSRLLQAQPAQPEHPPLDPIRHRNPRTAPESPPPVPERPAPPVAVAEAPAVPVAHVAERPPAPPPMADPPEPGFLVELFQPVLCPRDLFSGEPFLAPVAAFIPDLLVKAPVQRLTLAEMVLIPGLENGWGLPQGKQEHRIDARDITRGNLVPRMPMNGVRPDNPLPECEPLEPGPRMAETLFAIRLAAYELHAEPWVAATLESAPADLEFRLNTETMFEAVNEQAPESSSDALPAFAEAPANEAPIAEPEPEPEPEAAQPLVAEAEPETPSADIPQAAEPEPIAAEAAAPVAEEPLPVEEEAVAEPARSEEPVPEEILAVNDDKVPVAVKEEPVAEAPVAEAPLIPPAPPAFHHEVVIDLSIFGDLEEEPAPAIAAPVVEQAAETVEAAEEPISEPVSEPVSEPEAEVVAAEAVAETAVPVEPAEPEAAVAPVAAPQERRIPRMAETPFPIAIPPMSPVFERLAEIPAAAAPANVRVAAPVLDGIPVRPKMVYGARPEPRIASASSEAPAAAAPEPADVAASGEQPSRSDQRSESAQPSPAARPEAPNPPSEAPVPVASEKAASAPEPVRPTESYRSAGSSLNLDDLRLGLEQQSGSGWSKTSKRVIFGGAGLAIALVIGGLLLRSSFAGKQPAETPVAPTAARVEAVGPSLITSAGGWSSDWNSSNPKGPQISLFRPSLMLSDYRIEFQGQIENKSIGWVFRAANPRNYYVSRIEIEKGGLQPKVNVVHYAYINGEETQRTATPLPFTVHLDTVYKVRSDVYGAEFKTYVQEKLVDSWSDDRLKTGGFGLLTERGDRSQVRLVQLYELKAGN